MHASQRRSPSDFVVVVCAGFVTNNSAEFVCMCGMENCTCKAHIHTWFKGGQGFVFAPSSDRSPASKKALKVAPE